MQWRGYVAFLLSDLMATFTYVLMEDFGKAILYSKICS